MSPQLLYALARHIVAIVFPLSLINLIFKTFIDATDLNSLMFAEQEAITTINIH